MNTAHTADGHPVFLVKPGYFTRLHWRLRDRLPMWVVYDTTTREYPGKWVARMHISLPEPRVSRFVIVHDSLEELRDALPEWLVCIGRKPGDVLEIVEVWL